jgi:hypothetical protein
MPLLSPRLVALAVVAVAACVPEGPPTVDAGAPASTKPKTAARTKPSESALAQARGDAAPVTPGAPITAVYQDDFARAELGPDWNVLSPTRWRITGGRLCGRGAKNRGVWLLRRLPTNARIELDAIAESAEGDLKVELWGDGMTGATQVSYTNATSYLLILGGWRNTKHVLARLDEHGEDRLELDVEPNSDDERARPISAGQPYRFSVERRDGRTLTWSVNGQEYFELTDPDPLAGEGHEHLGFNDWDAPVCFDNLKITPL